jgi:transposase
MPFWPQRKRQRSRRRQFRCCLASRELDRGSRARCGRKACFGTLTTGGRWQAYAGLAPTPWKSGKIDHEQGVSKAGNPRLRAILVEMAWLWLRHQPGSTLARWYHDRVRLGGRLKKVTIVALARKLLVAIWKYVTSGVVIEGAALKAV